MPRFDAIQDQPEPLPLTPYIISLHYDNASLQNNHITALD